MGKESQKYNTYPEPEGQYRAKLDGFEPEPEPDSSQYIIPTTAQETTPSAVRENVATTDEAIDRLSGNLAPKVTDPNRVGNIYAKDGLRSSPQRENIANPFEQEPAPSWKDPSKSTTTKTPERGFKNFFNKLLGKE